MTTSRPRRMALPALAIAAVGIVAFTTVACGGAAASAGRGRATTTTISIASTASSVMTDAGYSWHTLPDAPITARDDAAGVWTGSRMLVWGGDVNGSRYFADGAAYDPTTRRWTKLPKAPLTARANPAFVWTGKALLIWGGSRGSRNLTDGALYDPTTRTWTALPQAPVTPSGSATAYRVGSRVVLVSTSPGLSSRTIRAAVFDPATARWTGLPALHLSKRHAAYSVIGASAGQRIFLWSAWSYDKPSRSGSVSVYSGVDGYTLRPAARSWKRNHLGLTNGIAYQALWTGNRVILPALDIWCGICPHPMAMNRTGLLINPTNGKRAKIAHGPVDDLGASYVWTGSSLLGLDTTTSISGPGQHTRPGAAAAWNPHTGRWTRLPNAPLSSGQSAVHVWTGQSELIWGRMYNRRSRLSTHSGVELAQHYVR
jgi:hypothetical protein